MAPTVLVLGNDSLFRRKTLLDLRRVAPELDLEPIPWGDEARALAVQADAALLVLLDDGIDPRSWDVLEYLRHEHRALPVVVLAAIPETPRAVAAIKLGARDYVDARHLSPVQLGQTVKLHMRRPMTTDGSIPEGTGRHGMIGASPLMRRLFRDIDDAAVSEASILIQGETGTGKELTALAVHRASRRAHREPMVVSCAELAEGLFEGELFGFVRGAFTGADRSHAGLFRASHGTTLFLDEIAELSPRHQAKLLRVVEQKTIRPLGSSSSIGADVRIVAATNRDLRDAVARGAFREDLYHRLATIEIHVPPLRERRDDIRLLVPHLLARFATHDTVPVVSETAMLQLLRADWSGNVRELQNVLQRALIRTPSPVRIDRFQIDRPTLAASLDDAAGLRAELRRHGGRLRSVADEHGLSLRTLQRRARKFGLDPREFAHGKRSIRRPLGPTTQPAGQTGRTTTDAIREEPLAKSRPIRSRRAPAAPARAPAGPAADAGHGARDAAPTEHRRCARRRGRGTRAPGRRRVR